MTPMNTGRSILKLVEQLCEEEPPSFQWQHLRHIEELSKLERLLALRMLRPTGNAGSIWCNACDSVHSVAVEFLGRGSYRAYCQEVGFFVVDAEDLRVLELDLSALTALIGRGLGIPPLISAEEIFPRLLYRVGSPKFGPYRTRVYFARCLDRVGCFAQVYSALEQHRDHTPVILVSTTPWQRIHRELPARHALVSLADIAELRGHRLKFNEDAFLTKLRGEEVAIRAEGIGYAFSPGCRSAVVGDREYQFTKKQAEVVEVLFEASQSGLHKMHQDEVIGRPASSQRIGQLFKSHPAYGLLIVGDSHGYYWLAL
jgi:hypothetical protein